MITIESVDKINVDELIQDFKVLNLDTFALYLKEVWRDLAQRSDDKSKGINKLTFSKYYELPGIICDRLFAVFDTNKNKYLDLTEFTEGMKTLFSESFENLAKLIFQFYDFDKDGKINKEDVRIVLSYVPLNTKQLTPMKFKLKFEQEEYKDRIESQDELHVTLDKLFKDVDYFDESAFLNVVENVNSDIFLFILIFLLEKRPFSKETIKHFENRKKSPKLLGANVAKSPTTSSNKLIVSPSLNSKFQPSVTISKSPTIQKRNLLGLGVDGDGKNMLMKLAGKPNEQPQSASISLKLPGKDTNEETTDEDVQIKIPVSRKVRHGLQELDQNIISKKYEGNDIPLLPALKIQGKATGEGVTSGSVTVLSVNENNAESNEDGDATVNFCGYLYKITENSQKLKKLWFKLIYKDLYYFKGPDDTDHKGMHNLSGVFIKEESPIVYDGVSLYCFSIVYPKKARLYYADNENDYTNWLLNLRKAIGYADLGDLYEVKDKLGSGKFGLVRLGIHKESGRKVAIKIINKKGMSQQDHELVKTEIEILKIAQHPNIIRLYDIFENVDYIYIIMEFCAGGDLFSHIEKRGFKLQEPRAAQIIHKLSAAVYFLHEYGIAHRDLKPENILMTDLTDDADIRLLDFGLSKIIGPNEFCKEPFGTISYVSPEVLLERPYDKTVDLWTIGIITYLLLCGCLPFDDEHSEREIARQTIHDPVPYPNSLWKKLSNDAKLLVDNLLQKDPSKRMSIKEVLEHQWIQKYNKSKLPEIRRKSKELSGGTVFKIYSNAEENIGGNISK